MALTLTEKILARVAGRDSVLPGDEVDVRPDLVALGADALPAAGIVPASPERIALLIDRWAPGDGQGRVAHARTFAAAHRVRAFVPPAESGALAVELLDRGLAQPGRLVVGADPMVALCGAAGALALVLDEADRERAIASGVVRVVVPRTLRVTVDGTLGRWASGADVGHHLLATLPRDRVAGAALELGGPIVERLEVTERIALVAALVDAGARAIVLVPDERTLTWLRTRTADLVRNALPDAHAAADDLRVVLDGQVPLVHPPGAVTESRPVTALPNTPLRAIRIGPTVGARVEDLRLLARLLKDHSLHKDVGLVIVPASRRHFLHSVEEGTLAILLRAGALVLSPVDAGATRLPGADLAAGDVGLATVGGLAGGNVFRAGVAVAAASAAFGRLAHPDELLRQQREAV